MQESIVYATIPKVFEVFKIIFDFIWKIISYPINFGNNFTISIFGIMAFCFIAVTLLKMFQLELPRFRSGWDSYGKFSTARSNPIRDTRPIIKKGKK